MQRGLNTKRPHARLLFGSPRNLSNHMDTQTHTGDTLLVKSTVEWRRCTEVLICHHGATGVSPPTTTMIGGSLKISLFDHVDRRATDTARKRTISLSKEDLGFVGRPFKVTQNIDLLVCNEQEIKIVILHYSKCIFGLGMPSLFPLTIYSH